MTASARPWWEAVLDRLAQSLVRAGVRAGCELSLWLIERREAREAGKLTAAVSEIEEEADTTSVSGQMRSGLIPPAPPLAAYVPCAAHLRVVTRSWHSRATGVVVPVWVGHWREPTVLVLRDSVWVSGWSCR